MKKFKKQYFESLWDICHKNKIVITLSIMNELYFEKLGYESLNCDKIETLEDLLKLDKFYLSDSFNQIQFETLTDFYRKLTREEVIEVNEEKGITRGLKFNILNEYLNKSDNAEEFIKMSYSYCYDVDLFRHNIVRFILSTEEFLPPEKAFNHNVNFFQRLNSRLDDDSVNNLTTILIEHYPHEKLECFNYLKGIQYYENYCTILHNLSQLFNESYH